MLRPYAVVDDEISRQGSLPMVAPVKPYTLQRVTRHSHKHSLHCTRPRPTELQEHLEYACHNIDLAYY